MTGLVIVDASVVVAGLLGEDLAQPALRMLSNTTSTGFDVIGPPLLPIEVTNAIYQRLRRREVTAAEASAALNDFRNFHIVPVPVDDLHERAFAFASDHGLPNSYDCVYVVLAEREGAELWTADARLFRAMTGVAPWVRWIGDFP